jgi:hypothetical protein
MIKRNKKMLKSAGEDMDEVFTKIDDAGASEFNPLETAAKVDDELGTFWRDPINKAETRQFENTLETILNRADDSGSLNLPIKEAQALKEKLGSVANWDNKLNVSAKEKMARDAYRVVRDSLDEAVEKSAKNVGLKGLGTKLKEAKSMYKAGKTAETLLKNRLDREQGNNFISLTDYLVGLAGTSSMGPGGIALLGVKKLANRYGSQTAAKMLDRTSKIIGGTKGLSKLAHENPVAFNSLVFKIGVQNEKNLGRKAVESINKAAENKQELKGQQRWMAQGFSKVINSNSSLDFKDPQVVHKLLNSKKGERLLARASDLNPNSKAMNKLMKDVENHIKGGK